MRPPPERPFVFLSLDNVARWQPRGVFAFEREEKQMTHELDLIDFRTACKLARISTATGERLLKAGEFPKPFRMGQRRLYRRADVVAFVNRRAEEALAA